MAYKIVNDDSLTSVANAIRVQGSISGTLEFPDGFVSAIQNLSPSPTLQTKSVAFTPAETIQTSSVTADSGYDGLDEVDITVNAMPSMPLPNSASATAIGTVKGVISPSKTEQYLNIPSGYNSSAKYYNIHQMVIGSKTITSNGTYYAEDEDAHGWDEVTVNVSGITPSGTYSITSNGIYNIVSFASVDVNVSGGGGGDHDAEDGIIARTISGAYENSRVTRIGTLAFSSCTSLTTVSFPNATSVGSSAFYNCTCLTTANFPNVTSIGSFAFFSCRSLTTVSFPNATSVGSYAFQNCTSLTTVSFPNATSIGGNAFSGCTSLTTVSFPNVTSIGANCFRNCKSLETLYVLASSVATLGVSALVSTPMSLSSYLGHFGSIYVPASLVDTYKSKANWSAYSARITAYEG